MIKEKMIKDKCQKKIKCHTIPTAGPKDGHQGSLEVKEDPRADDIGNPVKSKVAAMTPALLQAWSVLRGTYTNVAAQSSSLSSSPDLTPKHTLSLNQPTHDRMTIMSRLRGAADNIRISRTCACICMRTCMYGVHACAQPCTPNTILFITCSPCENGGSKQRRIRRRCFGSSGHTFVCTLRQIISARAPIKVY